jgi:serine phosphatase RsbU (regulator of sigma subunit)
LRKQDRIAALDESRIADLEQRVDELTSELEAQHREADAATLLDRLTDGLVGELDPDRIADRVEHWVAASLHRRASVTRRKPAQDGSGIGDATSLCIPLEIDDTPIGWWLTVGGPQLDARDKELLDQAADRAGRALAAATMVSGRAQGFRTLERSLLPDALLPLPGLQLASRYLAAPGAHDVGGDFYDAVRLDDQITLIVGDVQGKGVEAATLTSLARHTLRAGALSGREPSDLLAQLNNALLYGQAEQLHAGKDPVLRFVTAVVARVDRTHTGFSVCVARAGQPPPVIVRGAGTFEHVEPKGVLLGVCQDPVFEEARVDLAIGDTLILYTDGVIEQRDASRSFSERHLGMLVRNRRNVVDAEATAQLIADTVHLVAPDQVRDDVAILVACAVPQTRDNREAR